MVSGVFSSWDAAEKKSTRCLSNSCSFSISVFFYPDRQNSESNCCQHIDVLINSNEKEFVVIEATAEGIKKARETEVPGKSTYPFPRHRISAEK